MNKAQEQGIRDFHDLDGEVVHLIDVLMADLYDGPSYAAEAWSGAGEYPGFERGCARLRELWTFQDMWVDEDGCVSNAEPGPYDGEMWRVDAVDVKRLMLGALAEYI